MEVGEGGAGEVDGVTADDVLGRDPLPVAPDELLGDLRLRTVDPGSHIGRGPFQQAGAGFLERHRHGGTLLLVNGTGVSRAAADRAAQQGGTVEWADPVPVAGGLQGAGVRAAPLREVPQGRPDRFVEALQLLVVETAGRSCRVETGLE